MLSLKHKLLQNEFPCGCHTCAIITPCLNFKTQDWLKRRKKANFLTNNLSEISYTIHKAFFVVFSFCNFSHKHNRTDCQSCVWTRERERVRVWVCWGVCYLLFKNTLWQCDLLWSRRFKCHCSTAEMSILKKRAFVLVIVIFVYVKQADKNRPTVQYSVHREIILEWSPFWISGC